MKLIMMIMMLINLSFMMMNHPLTLTILIIIQTLNICILMSMLSYSCWFAYILFLSFLGGMLVIFIYMTTLASNEILNKIPLWLIPMTIMMYPINYSLPMPMTPSFNMSYEQFENSMNLMQLFNNPNMMITIMLISYLLITMICVIKISYLNQGTLRHSTYE